MSNEDGKQALALWKLGILGPLMSARLGHGDRCQYLREAAGRTHQMPDGRFVELSVRTIESWFYAYRKGGFRALFPKTRSDRDQTRSIRPDVADLLIRAKREKPRRSIRRIIRMLERARIVTPGELSHSSVHRLLCVHGASHRPPRGPSAERRSFIHEHASDLWVGDALHGPMVIASDRQIRKAYLLSQIDCATRLITHSYFALSEGSASQEHGFKQACLKHGIPRAYYVDLGSAYVAHSLRLICAELGIRLLHTGPKDCEAKGVIERWHRTWREEVGDELPEHPIPLAELNAKHWAWLSAEYHARIHDTTKRIPREHWLAEAPYLREFPRGKNPDEVFLHREKRKVRKDGTVRFRGELLEVRAELVGKEIELRFDPKEEARLPQVFLENRFVCDTVLLDRLKNATRVRQRSLGSPDPGFQPTGIDPLTQFEDEHYRRTHLTQNPKDTKET
jgi:putative transposase